jgi:hypothetical protein
MPASVNDYGGASPDTLASPPLGGPDGWAAAVASVVDGDDTTVNARIAAAVDAHEADPNPHPGYATDADVAAVAGTVTSAITDHEAKIDPHPQYLKPAEIMAGANITVTENAGVVTIAGQAGGGGGGGGGDGVVVLAQVSHSPTAETTKTSNVATHAALDPALSVTFTAPPSGVVFVEMHAMCGAISSASLDWGLLSGGSLVAGSLQRMLKSTAGTYELASGAYKVRIGGLTPGASYTWQWSFARVGTGGDVLVIYGNGYPALMLVTAEGSVGGGGASTLDDLTDVVAPANTPAGKVLGTTAEGVWGPIDPPAGGGGGGVSAGAMMVRTSDLAITTLLDTLITFTAQEWAVGGVATDPATGKFTVTESGVYLLTTSLHYSATASDFRVKYRLNSGAWSDRWILRAALATATRSAEGSIALQLAAGDSVQLGIYLDNAGNIRGTVPSWAQLVKVEGGGASTLDALTDVTAPANTPAGKVLGTTAEGVWGPIDPPAGVVKVSRVAAQSIGNASFPTVKVSFDTEDSDPLGFWAPGSPTRLTVPAGQGGMYLCVGWVRWAGSATGIRTIGMVVNGAEVPGGAAKFPAPASGVGLMQVTAVLDLSAGQYVELAVFQDAAASLDIQSATLSLVKVA